MSAKSRWQQVAQRSWGEISAVWVDQAASIPLSGFVPRPDPGLERLNGLSALSSEKMAVVEDMPGLRSQVLWEALYLYAKCDHAKAATEKLAANGMASWAMFNAYHSAYLGAKSILWLLGVPLPQVAGRQLLLDIFTSEAPAARKRRGNRPRVYGEFLFKEIGSLDQRAVWGCLQRVLRLASVDVWHQERASAIVGLNEEKITPPRNHFLYKPAYWIFDDIDHDLATGYGWLQLSTQALPSDRSFLLWLCFTIHSLVTELLRDLGSKSQLLEEFRVATRTHRSIGSPDSSVYQSFVQADAA